MFDITTAQALMPRELDGIIDRSQQLTDDQWAIPIEWLPGWTLASLLDHVGRAAGQQAEAFENLCAGSAEIPAYPHPQGDDRTVVADKLKRGRDRFVEAMADVDDRHLSQLTPLPFGLVPTPVALQIAVLEYSFHRWDLEHALGNASHELPADIAPHGFEFHGGLLPMLSAAGDPPQRPLAFALRSPAASLVLEHRGDGWAPVGEPSVDAVCTITGDVATLVMFGMGRIPADHAAIVVDGSAAGEAARFKSYFPGP